MVQTASVANRRQVRYASFDELLSDAERLADQPTRLLGKWSKAQIYRHLAIAMANSIDGFDFKFAAPMQWMARLLLKRRFINVGLPKGFPARPSVVPDDSADTETALAELRRAIDRVKTESHRAPHPAFGTLTREEWDQFNLRHAELHMSFIVPE